MVIVSMMINRSYKIILANSMLELRYALVILVIVLAGCTGSPIITNIRLVPNANPDMPLAGVLSFLSDRPVTATLIIDDGIHSTEVTPEEIPRTEHNVMVLGLRPDRQHYVTLIAKDKRGRAMVIDSLEITTPPLPEDFPPVELMHAKSGQMEPGYTMISPFRWTGPFDDDPDWAIPFIVDEYGEVVWYRKFDYFIDEFTRSYNGNLISGGHEDGRLFEMDMLGNIVQEWHTTGAVLDTLMDGSIPVDVDALHHEVLELANGNFLGLGIEVQTLEDFPLVYPPEEQSGTANVAGDVIIEFRRDGSTVRKWSVVDILDPRRLGEGSLRTGFYESLYEGRYDPLPMDITHSNAIYYVEQDDAVIVSSKVQCAVYKVDMSTGALIWILGDPVGWHEPWSDKLLQPKGDITWPCHQHGLELTPEGNLLLFDNGGARYIPPQEPQPEDKRFSRAVEYRIDEASGTVEEVWSYGPKDERFISPFICDADHLPETGNILITDGGRFTREDGGMGVGFGQGRQWARVLEVRKGDPNEKIWEIKIDDPDTRYSIYRAQRLKSLYPKLDRPTG